MYVSPNHPDYERLKGHGHGRSASEAPAPSGHMIASFGRKGPNGVRQELRLFLDEYEGHAFLSLRLWQADQVGGWWPLKGKGISIRLSEAQGLAHAIEDALELAGE